MPLIHTIAPENAEGKVKEIYNEIQGAFGTIPNAIQIYSSSPQLLARQWQQVGYYMQHPTLSTTLLAMMRMLISQNTNCEYCVGFNEAMLINMCNLTLDQVAAAKKDPASAPLSGKDKAMLLFVLKATKNSNSIDQTDIAALKAQGWNDGEILDGLNHGAYMLAGDTILNSFKIEKDF
ncbi:MAG: carboxymuconolactone decarboxylase family protein [Sulfuriferula sp.]